MNNVNQFLLDSNNRLSSYENARDENYVNADSFNAKEKFNDIWNAAHEELVDRYSLPAFHLWESGFVQGDASDDEVFEAKDSINKVEALQDTEGLPANVVSPTVSAEWNEGEIETDIYEFLDSELLKIVEPKTKKLIEEYEAFCKEQLA